MLVRWLGGSEFTGRVTARRAGVSEVEETVPLLTARAWVHDIHGADGGALEDYHGAGGEHYGGPLPYDDDEILSQRHRGEKALVADDAAAAYGAHAEDDHERDIDLRRREAVELPAVGQLFACAGSSAGRHAP